MRLPNSGMILKFIVFYYLQGKLFENAKQSSKQGGLANWFNSKTFSTEIMRDHQSHDILLMCTECHQLSNMHDMSLRRELAVKCNAPIGSDDDIKYHEINGRKTLRSAAR